MVHTGYGAYTLAMTVYRADKLNTIGAEITDAFTKTSGVVRLDADAEIPMTFTAETIDPDAVSAFEYIAPFFTVSWWDAALGAQSLTEQVGLYVVTKAGAKHTAAGGRGIIEAKDPCWVLSKDILPGYSVSSGANVVTTVKAVLSAAGFTRTNITAKANTFTRDRAWEPMSRLALINDMLFRIGYWPLWFDRQGIARSEKVRPLTRVEPARKISSAEGHVLDVLTIDPDLERICNRVVVVKQDATEAPIVVVRNNMRADSPVSQPALGMVIAKEIRAANLDDTEAMEDAARDLIQQGTKAYTRIQVKTVPDPRFSNHDVIHAVISRDDGTLLTSGRYGIDEIEISMSPKARGQRWVIGRLDHWE